MGNSILLWKILIVKNRIKNEIIDKVDHNSVQIFCKNKGQMLASARKIIRKNNVYKFGGVYNLVCLYTCEYGRFFILYCGMLGYFLKFYFLEKLVYNLTFHELL